MMRCLDQMSFNMLPRKSQRSSNVIYDKLDKIWGCLIVDGVEWEKKIYEHEI